MAKKNARSPRLCQEWSSSQNRQCGKAATKEYHDFDDMETDCQPSHWQPVCDNHVAAVSRNAFRLMLRDLPKLSAGKR